MMSFIRPGWEVALILTLSFISGTLQNSGKIMAGHTQINGTVGNLKGNKINIDSVTDLSTFFGIPYAKPPVGNLSFAPPQKADPWTGIFDATTKGPACPQLNSNLTTSDDCLRLNIYAPSKKVDKITSIRKPVILYIHGGNYASGHGTEYSFDKLAIKGVVIVTINYRLGPFGFLSTPDSTLPGNYGLRDVILALDWVKDNIADFGGDPGSITLFGLSSGASMVSMLTLSPLSKGKFHKAIMQSGSSTTEFAMRDTSSSQDLVKKLKCSQNTLTCLRSKSSKQILKRWKRQIYDIFPRYTPVVDGQSGVLPDKPLKLLQDPSLTPIPTLRGFTKDEAFSLHKGLSMSRKAFVSLGLTRVFGIINGTTINGFVTAIYQLSPKYTKNKLHKKRVKFSRAQVFTDFLFVYPTIREAILYSRENGTTKAQTYLYRVDRPLGYNASSNAQKVVVHEGDIGYFLNLPEEFTETNAQDVSLADSVSTFIANFAKHGNPTPTPVRNITWNPFIYENPEGSISQCRATKPKGPFETTLDYQFLKFDEPNLAMETIHPCNKMDFWAQILNIYQRE